MILYECLVGKTVDNERKISVVYEEIERNGVLIPEYLSERSKKIIECCLSINP
jgi:hypothetical protein